MWIWHGIRIHSQQLAICIVFITMAARLHISCHSCPLSSSLFIFLLFSSLQMPMFLLLLLFLWFAYLYVQTLFNQLSFSFLRRINHNLISFWCKRNICWISPYLFQGHAMDCFFAIQGSFLSRNRCCFQWIIGIRLLWPFWIHTVHVQRLQAHYLIQSNCCLPNYWWIWKGFWGPQTCHWFASSRKTCWELFPHFEWTRFACAK